MASSWMAHEIASVPELVARQEVLLADACVNSSRGLSGILHNSW